MWYKIVRTSQSDFIISKGGASLIVILFEHNGIQVMKKKYYEDGPSRDIAFIEFDIVECHDILKAHETSMN